MAKKAYALVWQLLHLKNVIMRMGVFHTICSLFGTIGKILRGSGLTDIVIESGICASGSLDQVLKGKHYNRAFRVHKLVMDAPEWLLLQQFEERQQRARTISIDTANLLYELKDAQSPCKKTLDKAEWISELISININNLVTNLWINLSKPG